MVEREEGPNWRERRDKNESARKRRVGRSSVLDLRLGRAQVVHSAKLCNTWSQDHIELKLLF